MKQISTDPYTRETLVRMTTKGDRQPCAWCGQPAKYRYGTESPMGRTSWQVKSFCSIGCMRTFHG